MQIYRGDITLLDYVFFATTERGKVYETGPFLHNYALTYALRLVNNPTYTYAQVKQEPHYVEELTPLNGKVYVTPGKPHRVHYRTIQWNTIQEGYAFPGKERSLGYPNWGFARVLRPGSRFVCYLLIEENASLPKSPALRQLLAAQVVRIRLGKFAGKARLTLQPALKIDRIPEGDFVSPVYLNWRDLPAQPHVFDVVASSLPTRLLARSHFEDLPHYRVDFPNDQTLYLPAGMGFLKNWET
jgi:CRISPR-associated protein Csc1